MNCITHHLPELESATSHVREALQAILHTILFIRSPGPVAPFDVHCESFRTTYTRIATGNDSSMFQQAPTSQYSTAGNRQHQQKSELDCKVDDSIETFLRSLAPIGPELMAGCLTLSFYERKAKNKLFGLVHQEEKVVWEQWVLRVVVNNTPRPMGGDEASVIERQRIQDTAEGMLKAALFRVFELAGNEIVHIPSVMYDFDINNTKNPDDRDEVYSRVSNMPALINLGS
ncbi:hypothetical protein ACHAWO_000660 [Cyclotella atomus]|uniref:Autophagy-related protein 101 n=1 Tax=Cyclotella atomus TaxID=382360 RepID=A0ABD3QZM5_9STRA